MKSVKNNGIESNPCFRQKGNRKEGGPEKATGKCSTQYYTG